MNDFLDLRLLGRISYDAAMHLMGELHAQRLKNQISDTILVLEHDPVITKGRRLHDQKIPFQDRIEQAGIAVRDADRGGLLTYHGPGQIVVYFILKLEDHFNAITGLVQHLEKILMAHLAKHDIVASIRSDHPGVWVDSLKIASLGLRVEQGVTRHGISLNISNDLGVYHLFDPCGMSGSCMTTLEKMKNRKFSENDFQKESQELGESFASSFTSHVSRMPRLAS